MTTILRAASILMIFGMPVVEAAAQDPAMKDKIAVLKTTLQQDQATLRSYEWIETVVITAKGEEKSRKQNRCYYGADGAIQKVPISSEASDGGRSPRGIRGRIVENKKEEVSDYMNEAVALVKSYIPPDPVRIQAASDAGKTSVHLTGPDKRAVVEFRDYHVTGDSLSLDADFGSNTVHGVSVKSFLGEDRDPVTLNVTFGKLDVGAGYPAQTTLNAAEKEIVVTVQNSGYRKSQP